MSATTPGEKTLITECVGGLDTKQTHLRGNLEPGKAQQLENFEASLIGGYRRINGFIQLVDTEVVHLSCCSDPQYSTKSTCETNGETWSGGSGYTAPTVSILGNATATATVTSGEITGFTVTSGGSDYVTTPNVSISDTTGSGASAVAYLTNNGVGTRVGTNSNETRINGALVYKDGYLVARDGGLWWSTDGITWLQVNKDTGASGMDSTALAGATILPRTQKTDKDEQYNFAGYLVQDDLDESITIVDNEGTNKVANFRIDDSGSPRKYIYQELDTGAWGTPVKYPSICEVHRDHVVVAGDPNTPDELYYSTRYNDKDYKGSSAGALNVGDKIVGLKTFRDKLIVFCENSIVQVTNLAAGSSAVSVQDLTRNIGCVDGQTIQEVGGDLIFLAPDGLRNIAATTRIDDLEISTLSTDIPDRVNLILANLDGYKFSSMVLRDKNQYRLFWYDKDLIDKAQKGIGGTLKKDPQSGGMYWEWFDLKGIAVTASSVEYNDKKKSIAVHGDPKGFLHFHDLSNDFNGNTISAYYKTPDISFDDAGLRKTLYSVYIFYRPEGTNSFKMNVQYDRADTNTHNPVTYETEEFTSPSVYGYFGGSGLTKYGPISAGGNNNTYGSGALPYYKMNVEGSGYLAAIKFITQGTGAPFTIQGFHINYILGGRR